MTCSRSARDAGDARAAELLEGVARGWARAAKDLVEAIKVEQEATAAQQKAAEARAQAERERALLEETLSRKGRAQVELDRAEAEAAARKAAPPPREKGGKKKGHGGDYDMY